MNRMIPFAVGMAFLVSCQNQGKAEADMAEETLAIPDFDSRLKMCYERAKQRGILDATYRITDKEEYFAEAVQDWFNVNAETPHADGKHNWCNTREELQEYDPDLYNLLALYFPKTSLRISKHLKMNNISRYEDH